MLSSSRSIEPDQGVMDEFWGLCGVEELVSFRDRVRPISPFTNALAHVIDSWIPMLVEAGGHFDPEKLMSRDLTSAYYGTAPAIFMGTNLWATKRWLTPSEIEPRTDGFANQMRGIRSIRPDAICFVMVPEKDVMIDRVRGTGFDHATLEHAMARFADAAGPAPFIFDGFIDGIGHWDGPCHYDYPDSHLMTRDYYLIFQAILRSFGLPEIKRGEFQFANEPYYGDLAAKFREVITWSHGFSVGRSMREGALTASGSTTFEQPLADTTQHFVNPDPIFDFSVQIFGDSHSSIFGARKLTYMFANTFRECTFSWNPYGVRGGDMGMKADLVVMEIAQRFVL